MRSKQRVERMYRGGLRSAPGKPISACRIDSEADLAFAFCAFDHCALEHVFSDRAFVVVGRVVVLEAPSPDPEALTEFVERGQLLEAK